MTRKYSIIGVVGVAILLIVTLAMATYYWTSQALPRRDMMAYAPDNTVVYLEINSLTDLLDGVVGTTAWQQLAPALGIPAQWNYAGDATKFLANTGFGPEEGVLLARAQYAAVVGGLDAQTIANTASISTNRATKDDPSSIGAELEIVPQVAFLIETRTPAAIVERYWRGRVDLVARRIYDKVTRQTLNYQQLPVEIWRAMDSPRQLVAARYESLVIVGNQQEIVERCLATCLRQRQSLQTNPAAMTAREAIAGQDPSSDITPATSQIFGYVAKSALTPLITLQAGVIATDQNNKSVTSQDKNQPPPANKAAVNKPANRQDASVPANNSAKTGEALPGELLEALSNSLLQGVAYQARFHQGKLAERFLAVLPGSVIADLPTQALSKEDPQLAQLIPATAKSLSMVRVPDLGQNFNKLLKTIAANSNVVVGFALREVTLDWGRRYGLDLETTTAAVLDGPAALIEQADGKLTLVVGVKDQLRALALIKRYLQRSGGKITSVEYRGTEIVSNEAGQAAAFVKQWLIFSQPATVQQMVEQLANNHPRSSLLTNYAALATANAQIINLQSEDLTPALAILRLSQILRTTNGTRAVLQQPAIQAALATLPATVSVARVTSAGLLIERSSALGLVGTVLSFNQAPEIQEVTVDEN